MPTRGSALIGFMDQQRAKRFLIESCIPADPSEAALDTAWDAARRSIGDPVRNAGYPEIADMPYESAGYVSALRTGIWAPTFVNNPAWDIKLVELEPLLAFQFQVDVQRSDHHCAHLPPSPALVDLLPTALPLANVTEPISVAQTPQSIVVKSRSLNVQAIQQGQVAPNVLGMQFGVSLPFVHVVRLNGRCYLHNGYHRAYGAMLAGATHIPAVFRDVDTPAAAGIRDDGNTFDVTLLESAHPPALGNFRGNGSSVVALRAMTRILHVSWAEYAIPDE